MDLLKKLNLTSDAYEKAAPSKKTKQNWSIGPQKDVTDFAKGADEPGSLKEAWNNIKKAFKGK